MLKRGAFVTDGSAPVKKFRGSQDGGHRFAIGNMVPGIVIGKGGLKVKNVREEAGVNVSISDSVSQSQDRVMVIRGEPANVATAILMISQLILDANETSSADKQASPDVRVLLHQIQAGAIIGKAGATIRQIMADSGAQVRVTNDALPGTTEKVCIMVGSPAQLQAACELVLTKLVENPIRESTQTVPYLTSPQAPQAQQQQQSSFPPQMPEAMAAYYSAYGAQAGFNPYMNQQMMMAAASASASQSGQGGAGSALMEYELVVPAEAGGAIIGKGGQAVKAIRQHSDCNVSVGETNGGTRVVTIKGAANQIPTALNMIKEVAELPGAQPQSEIISIPTSCSGAVIGKGGRAINEIKAMSSCNISLAEPSAEAPEMRTVNITGTNIAVQIAAFLVRQKCEQQNAMASGAGNGQPTQNGTQNGEMTCTEQISIPSNCAGNVIGKRGATIDSIKSQSGCSISIKDSSNEAPDTRLVVIQGSAEGIQSAKMLINQYMNI